MKRFYCTVCQRLKRVQKYPASVENTRANHPEERIGRCTRHDAPLSLGKATNKSHNIPVVDLRRTKKVAR